MTAAQNKFLRSYYARVKECVAAADVHWRLTNKFTADMVCKKFHFCRLGFMMRFIALKTEDGAVKGKLTLYCWTLGDSRQGFYKYLANRGRPWKYQTLADEMLAILAEDTCNDTYGRKRMYQALLFRQRSGVHIPSERTVYRVMEEMGISHRPKRKPNGITKADREARKSDDLLKRDFSADEPLKKCVTDITEIKARDGRLYISAIFDCFDSAVLGLAMDTNMKAELCQRTLTNAAAAYPGLRGAIVHPDRGTVYQRTLPADRCPLRKYVGQNENRTHLRPLRFGKDDGGGVEVPCLALLPWLLEQPQDLLRQRRLASPDQAAALL